MSVKLKQQYRYTAKLIRGVITEAVGIVGGELPFAQAGVNCLKTLRANRGEGLREVASCDGADTHFGGCTTEAYHSLPRQRTVCPHN